jgi:4-hydroxybenzoate polyprenyltransferase
MDAKIQEFLMGGLLALFALIALFAAARSEGGVGQYGACAVAAIFVGLIFYRISLVKHDNNDAAH